MKHLLFLLMLPVAGYGQRNEYKPDWKILNPQAHSCDWAIFGAYPGSWKGDPGFHQGLYWTDTDFVIRPVYNKSELEMLKERWGCKDGKKYFSLLFRDSVLYEYLMVDEWVGSLRIMENPEFFLITMHPSQLIKINDSTFKVMK